jgi:hypothetical protein
LKALLTVLQLSGPVSVVKRAYETLIDSMAENAWYPMLRCFGLAVTAHSDPCTNVLLNPMVKRRALHTLVRFMQEAEGKNTGGTQAPQGTLGAWRLIANEVDELSAISLHSHAFKASLALNAMRVPALRRILQLRAASRPSLSEFP